METRPSGTSDQDRKLPTNKNEIRVASHGKIKNYVQYAINVFKNSVASEIIINASGDDISKAVTVAEITKRRVAGLHQISRMGSQPRENKQPLSGGNQESSDYSRHESWVAITLSLQPLDRSDLSYQPPLPADQVEPLDAPPPSRSAAVAYSGNSRRGTGRPVRGRGGGAIKFGGMSDSLLDSLTGPLPPAPEVTVDATPAATNTSMQAEATPPADKGTQRKGKKKKQPQQQGRQQQQHQQKASRGGHDKARRGGPPSNTPPKSAAATPMEADNKQT